MEINQGLLFREIVQIEKGGRRIERSYRGVVVEEDNCPSAAGVAFGKVGQSSTG